MLAITRKEVYTPLNRLLFAPSVTAAATLALARLSQLLGRPAQTLSRLFSKREIKVTYMSKTIRLGIAAAAIGGMTLSSFGFSAFAASAHKVSSAAPKATVAFLGPEQFTGRWVKDKQYFDAKLHSLDKNIKILDYNANANIQTQQQNADAALAAGAKVVVLAAVDQNQDVPIVNKLEQNGVKVLAYDRMIQSPLLRAYDSFNNVGVGVEQGSWLASHAKCGNIIEIRGSSTDHNAALFYSGFAKATKAKFKSGCFKLAYFAWTPNWTPATAGQEMDAALAKVHNKVKGVYSMNDAMAAQVYASLQRQHKGGTPLTGQDAQPDGLGRILAHQQGMTVYKPIYDEAYAAAQVAYNWVRGKGLPNNFKKNCGVGCAQASGRHVPAALYHPIEITIKNVGLPVKDKYDTWHDVCTSIGKPVKPYCGLPH
jgi:D-xylose transport system substrate-binding protein